MIGLVFMGAAGIATAGSLDTNVAPPLIVEEAAGSSSGTAMVALLAILMSIPVLAD